jgi:Mn-dependent DtxR family transcriptional regulator
MRVLCKTKMENEHKSVGEVASLCNVSANAVRAMIEEASDLGFIERHPDTHHVCVNSIGLKIWHRYIESLYTEDETFIR